jgi:hypothetical protein
MPTFDVDPDRITVFHIDGEYLFSHYFTRQDLFEQLSDYYNKEANPATIDANDATG